MSRKAILAGTFDHEEPPASMEAPQTGPAPMLLNIPGEIRNRIYNFAQEVGMIKYHDQHLKWEVQDSLARNPHQFLSLTQVCREIRLEFLPLYRARTTVCVQPHKVYDYINTVLAPAHVEDEDFVGNIVFDLTECEDDSIDIKPLLQLLSKARRLSVEVIHDYWGDYDFVNIGDLAHKVLNMTNPTLFSYYLDEAICAIVLLRLLPRYDGQLSEMILVIKAAHWKPWLKEYDHWCDGSLKCQEESPKVEKWALTSGVRPRCNCSLGWIGIRLKFECEI